MLQVHVRNNIDFRGDHSLEWKLGGMGMHIIQVEGRTAYTVLTNNGGEIEPGDRLLFQAWYQDKTVDLFELAVPDRMEQELVIELDESAYEDQYCCWQTATITPISFRLDGRYGSNWSSPKTNNAVSITLKDGTSFDLASAENGYADSAYGTYGSMSFSSKLGCTTEIRAKGYLAVLPADRSGRTCVHYRVRCHLSGFAIIDAAPCRSVRQGAAVCL